MQWIRSVPSQRGSRLEHIRSFNSMQWIHASSFLNSSWHYTTFNSMQWILRNTLLISKPRKDIDRLSTPCNGFGEGYKPTSYLYKAGTFNSMQWIHGRVKEQENMGRNNFQLHAMDSSDWVEWRPPRGFYLSTPCNGFPNLVSNPSTPSFSGLFQLHAMDSCQLISCNQPWSVSHSTFNSMQWIHPSNPIPIT